MSATEKGSDGRWYPVVMIEGSSAGAIGTGGGAATSSVTAVGDETTTTTLKAANAARKGLVIYNDSSAVLYVKLGSGASTTSFTVKLNQGDVYELPSPIYTGIVTGVWASDAGGSALVTELTA